MNKVFLDTDVLIDFLTKRPPFDVESMKLFEYAFRKELIIFVSALSLNNIYYIVSKLESKQSALNKIKNLLQLVEVLPVDKQMIENALNSNFKDFEDGTQHYCAVASKLEIILTRNTKDYSKSSLSILTPKEFLAGFEK